MASEGPTVWILNEVIPWDSSEPIGVFADEADAVRIRDELAGSDSGSVEYEVIEVPTLGPLTVTTLWESLTCSFTVYWNGRVGGDRVGEVTPRVHLAGVPGDEHPVDQPPAALEVDVRATEAGYRLGVSLRVTGTDIGRVRDTFGREREAMLADPAGQTIKAWVASDYLPRWTFGRDENAALAPALADALRAAGKGDLVASCVDVGS